MEFTIPKFNVHVMFKINEATIIKKHYYGDILNAKVYYTYFKYFSD